MQENVQHPWQIKTFDCGEKITNDTDTLWLIKQGAVKISTCDLKGKVLILGYWGKGDVVGQAITQISPYDIECLTPVETACVPYQDWHFLAKEIRNCYQNAERIIYVLGQNSVEEKLLELLIYLGDKFGVIHGQEKKIMLPLSHRELANFLRTTRVSITRAMNRLQTKNFIDNPKRSLIILRLAEIPQIDFLI